MCDVPYTKTRIVFVTADGKYIQQHRTLYQTCQNIHLATTYDRGHLLPRFIIKRYGVEKAIDVAVTTTITKL